MIIRSSVSIGRRNVIKGKVSKNDNVPFRSISINVINVQAFVNSIINELKPPVANRLMFDGKQFKVMIVGGPNERDDFHIQNGEEIFFQIRGQMNLDIMSMGQRRRIGIKEGSMFRLPRTIPHSPQRYSDTVGIVLERTRLKSELDKMVWYAPGTDKIIFGEEFYCSDLGTQLKPIIENFMKSDEYKMHIAGASRFANDADDEVFREHMTTFPFNLSSRLDSISNHNSKIIHGEFNVTLLNGIVSTQLPNLEQGDLLLWQQRGSTKILVHGNNYNLKAGEMALLDATERVDTEVLAEQSNELDRLLVITNAVFAHGTSTRSVI